MRNYPVRISALPPEAFTEDQKTLVGAWNHLNFSRVVVRHPDVYRVFLPFLDKLIRGSVLPPRDREILCLRTLALCGDLYEADHHVTIARKAGLTDAEIDSVKNEGAGLSSFDRCLMRAADDLIRNHRISDGTWQDLSERYTQEQMMEVVFLVGCYDVMAMATKSFGIELESDPDTSERLAQLRQYT